MPEAVITKPRASLLRSLASTLALGAACFVAGCDRSLAAEQSPDFTGIWDITYDDAIRIELHLGKHTLYSELDQRGGLVTGADAGLSGFELDCARSELVCPYEVWPRELTLQSVPGKLQLDGVQFQRALDGLGKGKCVLKPGSMITAELVSIANASAVRPEAVALTAGQIHVRLDGSCFGAEGALPAGAEVELSSGFTAAKR